MFASERWRYAQGRSGSRLSGLELSVSVPAPEIDPFRAYLHETDLVSAGDPAVDSGVALLFRRGQRGDVNGEFCDTFPAPSSIRCDFCRKKIGGRKHHDALIGRRTAQGSW